MTATNFPASGSHTVDNITYTYNSSKSIWEPADLPSAGGSAVGVYATAADLPLTGNTDGDQAFVTTTKFYYVYDSGWFATLLVAH